MISAVIFTPFIHAGQIAQCLDYCARHGYEVLGVVTGDWKAAAAAAVDATAVLVVPRPDNLDPDRLPRTEVAATGEIVPEAGAAGVARRRRPRPLPG